MGRKHWWQVLKASPHGYPRGLTLAKRRQWVVLGPFGKRLVKV
jgi:hypothetical protein